MPDWFGWLRFVTPVKYGFDALIQNEVRYTAESNIEQINIEFGIWKNIAILLVLGLAFKMLGLLILWCLRTKLQSK